MNREDVILGAYHALAHAVRLLDDAAILYTAKRASSSFLLAVAAREEVGQFNILNEVASEISNGGTVSVGDIQKSAKPSKRPHQAKLEAGQSTFYLTSPLPALSWEERKKFYSDLKKRDSENLHIYRLAAQYVDLNDDGTWSLPSSTKLQDALLLISTVAGEIGDLLCWTEANNEYRGLLVKLPEALPRSEDFLACMFSL
jgi:AbiV family abortive infection protein